MTVNVNLLNSNSITNIATNFDRVKVALGDALSRKGDLPNQMNADLDMNGNDLINIKRLDVDDLTIEGQDLSGLLFGAQEAAIDAAASALIAEQWAAVAGSGVLPDLSIVRAKLSAALSGAIVRNLSEFGAVGNGIADDTAAVNAWLASSPYLAVNNGTYLTGKLTIPATTKQITGFGSPVFKGATSAFTSGNFRNAWTKANTYNVGDMVQFLLTFETITDGVTTTGLMYRAKTTNTNVPPSPNPAGADTTEWEFVAFDTYVLAATCVDLSLDNIGFSVSVVNHPQVRTINMSGCSRVRTNNLHIPQGGGYAIYMGNCVDVVHVAPRVYNYGYMGILAEGASQRLIKIIGGHVETSGTHLGGYGTAHGISFSLGKQCQAIGCTSLNAGVFGMNANEVDGFVLDGISIDSAQEGFNTISGKNGRITGIAKWVARVSIDFGVSIDGTTGTGVSNVHSNVIVENSGVSAFVFTGSVVDCTAHVISKNCNQTNAVDEAGILFSGVNCQRNTGYITMVDEYVPHRMRYGIAEINKGNGIPTNNTLVIESVVGPLTADVIRGGPTSRIFGMKSKTFVPVLSDGSGNAITAATTNVIIWNYAANGIDVEFNFYCVPTAIGAATGNTFRATVPVPAATLTGSGYGSQSTTGNMLRMENSTTHLLIYNYNSTGQPAINTNRITLQGKYTPSV